MSRFSKISRHNTIFSLFFFFCLFPFFSPFPLPTDTQPLAAILAVVILAYSPNTTQQFITRTSFHILLSSLLIFTYFAFSFQADFNQGLLKSSSFVAAFITYAALLAYLPLNLPLFKNTFKFCIVLYSATSFLILCAPSQMYNITGQFVRAINTAAIDDASQLLGYRGVSSFSTEPGLFGGMMVGFLLILNALNDYRLLKANEYFILSTLIIVNILLSKSGMGYALLVLYIILSYRPLLKLFINNFTSHPFRSAFIAITIFASGLFPILTKIDSNRGLSVLLTVSADPTVDTSFFGRLIDFSIGWSSLIFFPFGTGFSNQSSGIKAVTSHIPFIRSYYGSNIQNVGLVSSTSTLLVACGTIGLLILIYCFIVSRSQNILKLYAFIFLSFSFSAAFPLTWLLLSLPNKRIITPPKQRDSATF